MGVDKTNRRPAKFRNRKAKTKNGRQDQRLAKLEKTVFTALERKVKDWQNGTWNVTTTPTVLNNSNILSLELAEGTSASDRLGQEICLLNQTVRFNVSIPDGGDTFNQMRFIICESTDGSTPLGLGDILEYGNHVLHSTKMIMCSPYKTKVAQDNKGYKVHYDKVFELNAYDSRCITAEAKIKYGKNGRKVQYPALTASEQPVNHNLHIMMVSDSGSVLHPGVAINIRSRFFDA
ncbi:MAG: hypothetical protein [Cressdnaviricota sp.]|nr:MAG: hypothetical protein [Cressdnaviricota sp.]